MNTSLVLFAVFLVAHFIADFWLQDRDMALRKSSEFPVLLRHLGAHYLVFGFLGAIALSCFDILSEKALFISAINAILHGVIDWNIWRGYKRYATKQHNRMIAEASKNAPSCFLLQVLPYPYWEDHYFYLTLGLDQLLHGLSIILAMWIVLG